MVPNGRPQLTGFLSLECGNMLIMTLSHYQKTGDKSLITTYVRPSISFLIIL